VVAAKELSHGGQLEPAAGAFSKQAHARECPQQAIEAVFGDSGFTSDVAAPPRSIPKFVRDADFDDGPDRLTDPLADHHLK
jgi:hypothetical protein